MLYNNSYGGYVNPWNAHRKKCARERRREGKKCTLAYALRTYTKKPTPEQILKQKNIDAVSRVKKIEKKYVELKKKDDELPSQRLKDEMNLLRERRDKTIELFNIYKNKFDECEKSYKELLYKYNIYLKKYRDCKYNYNNSNKYYEEVLDAKNEIIELLKKNLMNEREVANSSINSLNQYIYDLENDINKMDVHNPNIKLDDINDVRDGILTLTNAVDKILDRLALIENSHQVEIENLENEKNLEDFEESELIKYDISEDEEDKLNAIIPKNNLPTVWDNSLAKDYYEIKNKCLDLTRKGKYLCAEENNYLIWLKKLYFDDVARKTNYIPEENFDDIMDTIEQKILDDGMIRKNNKLKKYELLDLCWRITGGICIKGSTSSHLASKKDIIKEINNYLKQ